MKASKIHGTSKMQKYTAKLGWKGQKEYKLKDIQNSTKKRKLIKLFSSKSVISFMKKNEWENRNKILETGS